jgi:hypothetical protein
MSASTVPIPSAEPLHEPTFAAAWFELRCLLRWGFRRWPLAVILCLLTGFAVGRKVFKSAPSYRSTVTIQVKANHAFADGAPPSAHELTLFIMGVALADTQLIELAEQLGYDLGPMRDGKPVDLQEFRDAIAMVVFYDTMPDRFYTETRIGIRFTGGDPEGALKGARTIAEHVVAFQNKGRFQNVDLEQELALETELGLSLRLKQVESELSRLKLQYSGPGGVVAGEHAARAVALENEVEQLQDLLKHASKSTQQSVLRGDFERDASGLGYEIVDRGALAPPARMTQIEKATIAGLVTGLGAFPLMVVILGAFSFRVYDSDSLRRLGLRSFGHAFADRPSLGCMVERQAMKRGRQHE